jgi:hypothetical protein
MMVSDQMMKIMHEIELIPSKAGQVVTDIAIQNPTTSEIKLPATSSVVIGVNEIAPLQGGEGNMTMSK